MAPSHERGFQKSSRALGVVGLFIEVLHLHAQGGVQDGGLVFLWQVKLALLLEACAGVALAKGMKGAQCLVSCSVTRRWVGMTDFGVGWACWS